MVGASRRIRLAATSAFLLSVMALGGVVTLLNANMLGLASWHVAVREQVDYRRGCQVYVQLRADDRPAWLEHGVHWSAQNRVRADNELLMVMTLYVSGQGPSLYVMGLVSTYDTLAGCDP